MNKIIKVTRRATFETAHRLHNPELSEAENKKIFGKCYNIHGHSYKLEVVISNEIESKTGMGINFTQLKQIVKENVIDKVDHKYINDDVAEFAELIPTAENMCVVFWQWLKDAMPDYANLELIKLYETENNFVEYNG